MNPNAPATQPLGANAPLPPCPWCGVAAPVVWVHGHGQCAACGVNAQPCCQGAETCPAR